MRVIAIGTDIKVFEKGRVYDRQKDYAQICDEYFSFVFTSNKNLEKIVDGNFVVVPIYSKIKLFSFFKLIKEIKKLKLVSDTVVYSQDAFEIGLFSYLISKIFKYKLVLQIHTDVGSKYFRRESLRNFTQFLLFKFLIKKAGSVRVVSEKIKKYLVEVGKINGDKIFVAPIFAGDVISNGEVVTQTKQDEILMLSRIEKVKNIPLAIKAFINLQKQEKYKNYKLKIVGSGTQKKYLQNKFKDVENLVWQNWSDNPQNEFQKAKVFLITSKYEGWGMTPIESVSCGTPVVMTNVGCANEFIFDNLNGKIAYKNKSKDVAEALSYVIDNLESFNQEKMLSSLKILQSKDQYLDTVRNCWNKTFT